MMILKKWRSKNKEPSLDHLHLPGTIYLLKNVRSNIQSYNFVNYRYWDEKCDNSPETRIELSNLSRKQKEYERQQKGENENCEQKRSIKLFKDDGQPLSVNEPRIPFTLSENDISNSLVLTIEVYR